MNFGTHRMSFIDGLSDVLYNKAAKHFLKKIYHVPVIANRPLVTTKKDFISFNDMEDTDDWIVDELYDDYLEEICKFCPTDILVNAKIIDDSPSTLIHYKQFRVKNFDDYIREYLKSNEEEVIKYLNSKNVSRRKERKAKADAKKPKK